MTKISEKDNCCSIENNFEYLNTMSLYLLVSTKKAKFCLFLISRFSELDRILSPNFRTSCFIWLNVKQYWDCYCWHKYFWWSNHFCNVILKEMESQKIFWAGNDVILWHYPLCCDAFVGASCQDFGNAVNIKEGIHITM